MKSGGRAEGAGMNEGKDSEVREGRNGQRDATQMGLRSLPPSDMHEPSPPFPCARGTSPQSTAILPATCAKIPGVYARLDEFGMGQNPTRHLCVGSGSFWLPNCAKRCPCGDVRIRAVFSWWDRMRGWGRDTPNGRAFGRSRFHHSQALVLVGFYLFGPAHLWRYTASFVWAKTYCCTN
jgi:hypothetical protein